MTPEYRFEMKVRSDYIKPDFYDPFSFGEPVEEWFVYGTDSGQSKPHMLDRYETGDDGRTAIFVCGLRVEPSREMEVALSGLVDVNGTPIRSARTRLVPVTKGHAHNKDEKGRAFGCGLCLYEARKRARKPEVDWALRYLRQEFAYKNALSGALIQNVVT